MKRNRSASVALVLCFVAMIAIVGAITFSNYQKRAEEELAKAEEEIQKNLEKFEKEQKEQETQSANTDKVQADLNQEPETVVPQAPIVQAPIAENTYSFSEESYIIWPIAGNVLLNYSMDKTIYFATLDQYKYNPAIIIGGEVGEEIRSVEDGKVTSIKSDPQTGNTVTIDLGDGYSAIYGQLGEVLVKEGEHVVQEDIIGYLGEPTKYYSVEGPNLYFQLLKDGEPVNPMEYLDVE